MGNRGPRFFGRLYDLVMRVNSGVELASRRRLNAVNGSNTVAALVDVPGQNEARLSWSVPTLGGTGSGHGAGVAPDPGATVHGQQWALLDSGLWSPIKGGIVGFAAIGTDQSTTSTSATDLATADTVTFTLDQQQNLIFQYVAETYNNTAGQACYAQMYLDGVAVGGTLGTTIPSANAAMLQVMQVQGTGVAAGSHSVDVKHWVTAGTGHWLNRAVTVVLLA